MHIWIDLIFREFALLALLLAVGSGPVAWLGARFDPAARFALAPVFGLCLSTAVTETLVQWEPARSTYLVLIPLALGSLAVAWPRGLFAKRLELRDVAGLALVCLVVSGPLLYSLHERASVGPVAFNVYDAAGYVGVTDAMQSRSIEQATAVVRRDDLIQQFWSSYAGGFQNLDATSLEASFNDILGLHASDTNSAFLLALLLVGAFGAFAAIRFLTQTKSWAAVLAGCLFGGPFFIHLWADSSQAAICGLALVLPIALLGIELTRSWRLADTLLLGLLAAGVVTLYPLFAPPLVIAAALLIGFLLLRAARKRTLTLRLVAGGALRIAAVPAVAAAISPVAFGRDLRYWQAILQGAVPFSGLPQYHLPIGVLPGWLLQTREFYQLVDLGRGGAKGLILAVILPLLFVLLIGYGLKRFRIACGALSLLVACGVLATYVHSANGCNYCVQRNLLPLGPLLAALLSLGIFALLSQPARYLRGAGAVGLLLVVVAVGDRARTDRLLVVDQAYIQDSANRYVLNALPARHGTLEVEGFGSSLRAPGELPLVYELADERVHGRISLPAEVSDYSALAYLGGIRTAGPEFKPDYSYVLTRFAGILTTRRLIARSGGIALEKRTQPLDVTLGGGLGAPLARLDTEGAAWVQGGLLREPVLVYVTGPSGGARVWARLRFEVGQGVGVPAQPGVTAGLAGTSLTVCVPARGRDPVRRAALNLSFMPLFPPTPHEAYPLLPLPAEGVRLASMTAVTGRCVPGGAPPAPG